MRPTELSVCSPANQTSSLNYPSVGRTGNPTQFAVLKRSNTLGKSKRFSHYDAEYKKTGYRIGPGSYMPTNHSIGVNRVTHTPIYKPPHHSLDSDSLCASTTFSSPNPSFVPAHKKRLVRSIRASAKLLSTAAFAAQLATPELKRKAPLRFSPQKAERPPKELY